MNPNYQTITFKSVLKVIVCFISTVLVMFGIVAMLLCPHEGEVINKSNPVGIMDGLDYFVVINLFYAYFALMKRSMFDASGACGYSFFILL